MGAIGRKLFQSDKRGTELEALYLLFSSGEVRRMDAQRDRLLLGNIARHAPGTEQKAALRRLGLTEPPPPNPDSISDELFDERYWILSEQIVQLTEMEDCELLRAAAFSGRSMEGCFAFCRLTGWRFPAPACDAYSHRDYACGRISWMTDGEVRAFCRKMLDRRSPFASEAAACLAKMEKGAEQDGL